MTHFKNSETKVFDAYSQIQKKNHHFVVDTTGLHINHMFPYLGASPDGVTYCVCHGKGLLKIKISNVHIPSKMVLA